MTNEETIFANALRKSSATERDEYLDQACTGNAQLRDDVERLLRAHDRRGGILEASPLGTDATAPTRTASEGIGATIGPYKLLEQIGGGGMGAVYMAEQLRPVRRKVALKIIKPGMDSAQIIARFEAERQALTMMDHPNIAKVLDAGTTDAGRPYFVMELVKGIPITDYCDQARLNMRQRLELFINVCNAVQHAHQKGVIHRDLKPSNVLVTLHDDKPVPKVIDFGIAKAAGQLLTDKTLFTNYAQIVGTPLYMSPEQAQISGLDVDTRSDVYALGVLLYELLTGTTPFDKQRLRDAAYDEMRRIIREEDPPKPSTRLSTMGEKLTLVSQQRHTDTKHLGQLVRGELDWIVMKALEKDRVRRYETATGLARDVQRYLSDEPVQACPPSARYRFRKFARRNKSALAVSGLVLLFLVLLGSAIGWTVRDRTARQARVSGQLELILKEVARLEEAEKWSEALISARQAEPALAEGEAPSETQERARQALADLKLVQQLEDIRAKSGTVWVTDVALRLAAQADQEYAAALRQAGIDLDALPTSEAVHRITARREIAAALLPALDDWLAVRIMRRNVEVRSMNKDEASFRRLIDLLHDADPDLWRQRVREAMARRDQSALADLATSAELDRQPAATLTLLYSALWASGKDREREMVLRRAQWKYPSDYWINHRLGVDLIWRRKPDDVREGIGFMRAALALRPQSIHALLNLGNGYFFLGQYDQAIACYRKMIEISPNSWVGFASLGGSLVRKGLYDEAIAALEQALKKSISAPYSAGVYVDLSMIHSSRPEVHLRNAGRAAEFAEKAIQIEPQASNHWTALGIARYRQSRWQEARTALEKALELGTDSWGGTHRWPDAIDWFFLAMSNWQLGQTDQARQCYGRAVQWMEKAQPWEIDIEELARFRTEAENLLAVPGSTTR